LTSELGTPHFSPLSDLMSRPKADAETRVRKHFDANTDLYVDKYAASYARLCQDRIHLLEQHIKIHGDGPLAILDVGCGGGTFTDLLLEEFPQARAYCLDFSYGMLRRNVSNSRKVLIQGDASALPFAPRNFDIINVDALMHHLVDFRGYEETHRAIGHFLSSLRGLLKPRGILIVREIYHESILKEDLGTRLLYEISTARLPEFLASLLKLLGFKTANAGICYLTRKQWSNVIGREGYKVISVTDKPWTAALHLRTVGFQRSGDLFYTLTPEAAEGG
jgi:SAM-dependent methyltransferase